MRIDVTNWPRLPKFQTGKPVYINYNITEDETKALERLGWVVSDVRLMSAEDMRQRQDIVLAWLEGLRQGTLEAPPKLMDFLELEARVCGLSTGKVLQNDAAKLDKKTTDQLLDFSSERVFKNDTTNPLAKLVPKE
jgi:hypothetical protein